MTKAIQSDPDNQKFGHPYKMAHCGLNLILLQCNLDIENLWLVFPETYAYFPMFSIFLVVCFGLCNFAFLSSGL